MSDTTTIKLDGHIIPKARPQFDGRNGRAYHKREYSSWLEDAGWQVAAQRKGRRHEGPIKVTIVLNGQTAAVRIAELDADQRPKGVRGDLDNIAGSILDALQTGGIISNDSQVATLEAWFWDDDLELHPTTTEDQ